MCVESSDLSLLLYMAVCSRIYCQISVHKEHGKAVSVFNVELFSALLKCFPGFTCLDNFAHDIKIVGFILK